MSEFDIAVIGGGPAGYVAAERAAAKGLRAVLFEKCELGGVCLNEGCIPTKTLLYSAKTYDNALHGDKYGIRTEGVGFDYAKMVARKNKVVRKLVAGVKMKLRDVEVVRGVATITGRSADGFQIECALADQIADAGASIAPRMPVTRTFTSANLIVCTGSEVFIPPIAGIAESRSSAETANIILTNREILDLKERPASLIIIGGGVIGMEFASLFNSLGTEVTVIEQMYEVLGSNDHEISEMIRTVYARRGVKFLLSCKVTRIDGNDLYFTNMGSGKGFDAVATASSADTNPTLASLSAEHKISAEKILISVGRRPVVRGFGLETLGIELNEYLGVKTDDHMRTNVPGVYAAGDVTGFSMLAHTACREAEVVINNLTGSPDKMNYDAVPGVVYTNPEVASAGLTYDAARTKGIAVREIRLPMAYAGRFVAENEGGEGLCKIVVGYPMAEGEADSIPDIQSGRVLGVHMIGNPASEIIWGACLAIEQKMTIREVEKVIFPHPTVAEIIKETSAVF